MLRDYISLPRTVHLLCLGTFVNRAGTFVIPLMTLYMRDTLGVDDAFAALGLGVFGLGSLCGSLAGGHLADRIGRRWVMVGALFGSAAALVLMSQLTSPAAFLGGVFVFAAIGETYRPAASAMIADVTAPAQRGPAFALMYVAINLGFAIGPAVGGIIAEHSFYWLFMGDAATCAAYGMIVLVGVRESLQRRRGAPVLGAAAGEAGRSETTEGGGAAGVEQAEPGFISALAHMLHDTTFLALCGAAFLIGVAFMQAMSTFPLYLTSEGFSMSQYGRIIALNGLLIVIGQLPLTSWMKGKRRSRLLVAAALLTALGFGLKAVAFSEATFMLTVTIWTLGEMLHVPLLPPLVAELAPESLRGRYMGVFGVCFSGANMIGAPLGGVVLDQAGAFTLWIGCAVLGLVATLLYVAVGRRVNRLSAGDGAAAG